MADAVLDKNAKGLTTSQPYLAQGAGMTIDSLKDRYAGLIQDSNFGGGGEGVLANKINALREERLGDMASSLDRELPSLYADQQRMYRGVSDANKQVIEAEIQARAQAEAARKAKRKALAAGVLTAAGAGAGAFFGGPAGAQIGAGAGSAVGSQL